MEVKMIKPYEYIVRDEYDVEVYKIKGWLIECCIKDKILTFLLEDNNYFYLVDEPRPGNLTLLGELKPAEWLSRLITETTEQNKGA